MSRGTEPALGLSVRDIVHLATSGRGGAGIAALRMAVAQDELLDSSVGVVTRDRIPVSDDDLQTSRLVMNLALDRRIRLASTLLTGVNKSASRQGAVLFTPLGISLDRQISQSVSGYKILHIHNVYNLMSVSALSNSVKVPIVATLHDERLLTNGCHYSLGCENLQTSCLKCPQSRFPNAGILPRMRANHKFFDSTRERLLFVAPSKWMRSRALVAGVAADRVLHIPNPIDTRVFSSGNRHSSRVGLGLASDAIVLGWLPGKGNAQFLESLHLLRSLLSHDVLDRLHVLTVGEPLTGIPFRTISVRTLDSEMTRAQFWSAADIGISSTSMDNFPNVVLESLAVGTPFIIPRVGGAAEAIDATGGGIATDVADPAAMADAVHRLIHEPDLQRRLGQAGSRGVRRFFSPRGFVDSMSEAYAALHISAR